VSCPYELPVGPLLKKKPIIPPPDVFSSSEDFDAWFKGKGESDEQQQQVVSQLHKVLRPFLLRRVKSEVEHSLLPKKEINLYVGMSDMQKRWYKSLLEKDIDAVNGKLGLNALLL
jgi:SWI/SNF-related matrix-associated actin-dependent regulator of chromatin subfamily A member 5